MNFGRAVEAALNGRTSSVIRLAAYEEPMQVRALRRPFHLKRSRTSWVMRRSERVRVTSTFVRRDAEAASAFGRLLG